jgi:hypothetical protein
MSLAPMGDDLEKLSQSDEPPPHPLEAAVEKLEQRLEEAVDDRYEERFLWVIVCLVFVDALIFSHMDNWTGPIIIGIFEFVAILVLARRWRIEEVPQILAKFLDRAAEHTESKK